MLRDEVTKTWTLSSMPFLYVVDSSELFWNIIISLTSLKLGLAVWFVLPNNIGVGRVQFFGFVFVFLDRVSL